MSLKVKLFKRIVSLWLAILLFVNPLAVPLAYAQEAEATPTPTEQTEPTPTPTEIVSPVVEAIPTEQPAPTDAPQSTITTGDAASSSQNDNTINTNQDTVNGSLTTPSGDCSIPEGQTTCPDNIEINNDNQATVSGTTDSSANTGENTESGSAGDASIDTGDATASGQITSEINSNLVILETTPSELSQPSQTTSGNFEQAQSLTPTPAEVKDLKVTNENDGKVENIADVSATTGSNLASENLGNVDLKTGDALAWANLLNVLNTNIVGGNFEVLVLDIKGDSNGDVNLNELWQQLQEKSSSDSVFLIGDENSSNLRFVVSNNNNADLKNEVNVSALSGDNQANQNNSASIETGNATALANVTNVVNTNILGSKFFFGIINITGQFKGNLILPRPELFESGGTQGIGGAAVFENQNTATVNDNVSSSADSGSNGESNNGGDNSINTGSAQSTANNFTLANLNLWQNNWFYMMMNVLGTWNGKTYNWTNPGSEEQADKTNQTYQTLIDQPSAPETESEDLLPTGSPTPAVEFQNENQAIVENNIKVNASTGGNQANENQNGATINTGNAKASSNLINLINLNILSSNWFMGLVNILGNWNGNVVFAYPDVGVTLSGNQNEVYPGSEFEYDLVFGNYGYESAENVVVKVEFPKGLSYESDTSGMPVNCNVSLCSWKIGNLERAKEGNFKIRVKIDPDIFSLGEITQNLFEKFIPKVLAAENSYELMTKAVIVTSLPDSNKNNNTSSKTTFVEEPARGGTDYVESNNEVDQRQPVLEVTAKNNVNDFVRPGDTVTFEITVKNTGEVRSKDTYLTHALYDGVPEHFGVADIKVGNIEPGKTAKVSFGMTLEKAREFHTGSYHTETKATGYAPNGNKVISNIVRTDFKINTGATSSYFEAQAIEDKKEDILGIAEASGQCPPPQKEKILPYLLLLALSSLWIVDRSRRLSNKYFLIKDEKN